jgi:FeS assembly protein IscX
VGLKWIDSLEIAIALDEAHPDVDPLTLNFVDLRDWVLTLEEFDDDLQHTGEKILKAIQAAWIEEREQLAEPQSEAQSQSSVA